MGKHGQIVADDDGMTRRAMDNQVTRRDLLGALQDQADQGPIERALDGGRPTAAQQYCVTETECPDTVRHVGRDQVSRPSNEFAGHAASLYAWSIPFTTRGRKLSKIMNV